MKKTLILLILIGLITASGYLLFREGSRPVSASDAKSKVFVVTRGESIDQIINNLSQQNLIRSRWVFYTIVKNLGIERKIQAGDFRLSPSMNGYQIAEALTHGTLDAWITIPEGMRKEEIAEIFSREAGLSEVAFNESVIEGSLFPDTYLMPKGGDVNQVIKILTSTMDKKYALVAEAATRRGYTRHEVLTLASLVEREASGASDRQEIANIIVKRWKNDWPLQIDATIQYAIGYRPAEKSWWTKNLTQDDYKLVKSPYNTYLNTGLPPGPICNPGFESIKAVVQADSSTKNWFYYHDEKGKVYFSEKLAQHERNSEK